MEPHFKFMGLLRGTDKGTDKKTLSEERGADLKGKLQDLSVRRGCSSRLNLIARSQHRCPDRMGFARKPEEPAEIKRP